MSPVQTVNSDFYDIVFTKLREIEVGSFGANFQTNGTTTTTKSLSPKQKHLPNYTEQPSFNRLYPENHFASAVFYLFTNSPNFPLITKMKLDRHLLDWGDPSRNIEDRRYRYICECPAMREIYMQKWTSSIKKKKPKKTRWKFNIK